MKEGDVQPASMRSRGSPRATVNSQISICCNTCQWVWWRADWGGDAISFADYVRSLDHDISTCAGTAQERDAAHDVVEQHRAAGAVFDTYTAWTVATMDAFDVLLAVFGKLVVPRSCIDELRGLRDRDEFGGEGGR